MHASVHAARAARRGGVLAAVNQSGPTVSFFDAASYRLLGSLETLAEPHGLCFDPVRRLLWCANTYRSGYYHANAGRRSHLTVIDPDARRIVEVTDIALGAGPHGLSLDVARGLLHVSVEVRRTATARSVVVDAAAVSVRRSGRDAPPPRIGLPLRPPLPPLPLPPPIRKLPGAFDRAAHRFYPDRDAAADITVVTARRLSTPRGSGRSGRPIESPDW